MGEWGFGIGEGGRSIMNKILSCGLCEKNLCGVDIIEVDWVAYPDVGLPGGLPAHDLSPRRQIGAVGELRQHFRLSLHHLEACSRYYIIEAVLFSYNHFLQPFLRRKSSTDSGVWDTLFS